MRRALAFALGLGLPLLAGQAGAHRIDEYLQATILRIDGDRIHGEIRLVCGKRVADAVISAIDRDRNGTFSPEEQLSYARRVLEDQRIGIDGQTATAEIDTFAFPRPEDMREGLGEIRIAYMAAMPAGHGDRTVTLSNRHMSAVSTYLANVLVPADPGTSIVAQRRSGEQSRFRIDFRQATSVTTSANSSRENAQASWKGQLPGLFTLGMNHIAEGTDHLLFLLVLLLAAPLRADGLRWGAAVGIGHGLARVLWIVTAFTIGHSIALSAAAIGGLAVPGRPVEGLIALSILVSAFHALRPIFPGNEPMIAGAFGLVHGLAFANTLERLGMDPWERISGTLAFNLGIETMQLLIVAIILPPLLVLAARPAYKAVRVGGALGAAVAAIGWIAERLFAIHTPVDMVTSAIARHGSLIAMLLMVVTFTILCWPPLQTRYRLFAARYNGR